MEPKKRMFVMPAEFYGGMEERKVNENVITQVFTDAGLDVSLKRISLSRLQAEQIIPLKRNNPMYEHEVSSLSQDGKIACLITLQGDNVDDVVRRYLPVGLDKFKRREFLSKSAKLAEFYGNGNSMYPRFLDASNMDC